MRGINARNIGIYKVAAIILITILLAPSSSRAFTHTGPGGGVGSGGGSASSEGISGLITQFGNIINQLIPLVASLVLLAFFWGLAKYIFNAGSEEEQEKGKRIMVAGIIALFLVASVGGIIDFIAKSLDIDTGTTISPPRISEQLNTSLDDPDMVYNGREDVG